MIVTNQLEVNAIASIIDQYTLCREEEQVFARAEERDGSATKVWNFLPPSGEFWTIDWDILNRITKVERETNETPL